MLTTITAVALRTVRHNDRSSILTAWSGRHGRLSLVMPAGNTKESRRRRALTMPLGLFEGVVNLRDTDTLLQVRDLRAWGPDGVPPDVASHPVRSAVAMFVAEVLTVATREGAADPALWSLIVETVVHIAYSAPATLANLPTAFLVRLAYTLGIAPDMADWQPRHGLDLAEGVFRPTRPTSGQWLPPDQAAFLRTYTEAVRDYGHINKIHLTRTARHNLMNTALRYYSLHHYPMDRLRSLDVLTTIFND